MFGCCVSRISGAEQEVYSNQGRAKDFCGPVRTCPYTFFTGTAYTNKKRKRVFLDWPSINDFSSFKTCPLSIDLALCDGIGGCRSWMGADGGLLEQ
uniref:Uncharacterized protein n=1 Tax=Romanomermis culicivorax TaxID=13658 RepID=A0A915I276_ROMCU